MSEPLAATADQFEYAIVEIYGHRRHAGRVFEVERFGGKMLRIDVPRFSDGAEPDVLPNWESHYYGNGAIFSYTPTTEEAVMRLARPYRQAALYAPKAAADIDVGDDAGEGYDEFSED